MFPVVSAFRSIPLKCPGDSDKTKSMHESLGSLLKSILVLFEKYGFKEFGNEGRSLSKHAYRILCV
jgi:molecular chaperone GrpE (heat shock protein)